MIVTKMYHQIRNVFLESTPSATCIPWSLMVGCSVGDDTEFRRLSPEASRDVFASGMTLLVT